MVYYINTMFNFKFICIFFHHWSSFTVVATTRLHFPTSLALLSPPNCTIYILSQSSHLSLGLPLFLPPLSTLSFLRQPFPSIHSTCPAHFNRLLTSFPLKSLFTPTSSLSSSTMQEVLQTILNSLDEEAAI